MLRIIAAPQGGDGPGFARAACGRPPTRSFSIPII